MGWTDGFANRMGPCQSVRPGEKSRRATSGELIRLVGSMESGTVGGPWQGAWSRRPALGNSRGLI